MFPFEGTLLEPGEVIGPEQLHSAKVSGLSRTSCQPQAWGREVESTLMGRNRDPGPHGLVILDDTGPKV